MAVPFQSIKEDTTHRFNSPLALSACQSTLSSLSAVFYLYFRRRSGQTWKQLLGLQHSPSANGAIELKERSNGRANGLHSNVSAYSNGKVDANGSARPDSRYSTKALLLRYFQCSVLITSAAPFGFAALSYITYPAMVLGKSCKLVPVMIMNVLLYRRKFAPHKYLVVGMVTLGITLFFGFGKEKPSKPKSNGDSEAGMWSQALGVLLLVINLAIDGATNSTQDEIFARFKVTGQQMMFWINIFNTLLAATISVLPLPYIPILHPSHHRTEIEGVLEFVRTHPSVIGPILQFSFTGALGQLFIFETLQHFGSLTLVYVLHVVIQDFTLPCLQDNYAHTQALYYASVCCDLQTQAHCWSMVGCCSCIRWHLCRGLGQAARYVPFLCSHPCSAPLAYFLRSLVSLNWCFADVHAKRVIQEKEKARIKTL